MILKTLKKLLLLTLAFAIMIPVSFASVFTDITSQHPYYEAIVDLHQKGVISGYSDNSFKPNKSVNRAEALKIILLGSNVFVPEIQPQEVFPDVIHSSWYGKFVSRAKKLKIVKGDSDTGLFRPGDTVNLAEALKMLIETNEIKIIQPTQNPYLDVDTEAWFSPYFSYAKGAHLMDESSDELVNPAMPITRGKLADLMYRLSKTDYVEPDGEASYYGEKFHGKTTASGEVFDASLFTAAHRTYAFGTWLKVTNVANGKSIKVKVNDRGPYAGENRIIDLSKVAFEAIASLSNGVIKVAVSVTEAPTEDQKKEDEVIQEISNDPFLNSEQIICSDVADLKSIDPKFFENIELSQALPNVILQDEALIIKGSTNTSFSQVSAFIVDEKNEQTAFSSVVKNNQFEIPVYFPRTGRYKLGLIPGESGQSLIKEITVVKNECIEEIENSKASKVNDYQISLDKGQTIFNWSGSGYNLFKITIHQGDLHKSYLLKDVDQWSPPYRDFKDFNLATTRATIRGATLNDFSVLQPRRIEWSPTSSIDFEANRHYRYSIEEKEIEVQSITESLSSPDTIQAQFLSKVSLRSNAALILPDGKVEEVAISSGGKISPKTIGGVEVLPTSSHQLSVSYKANQKGVYFLEVNNDQGLAVINVPIYPKNEFPLIPNQRDLSITSPAPLSGGLSDWRDQMLKLVNQDRADHGLKPLKLDDKLSQLAQYRSDDMNKNQYFSHWDKQGRSANDLRSNFGITTQVSENLAKDLSLELAQYGLMRSAIHRSNILTPDWTRLGLGITEASDGTYLITQIFSTEPLDLSNLEAIRTNLLDIVNQNRSFELLADPTLNAIAQNWSEKMVNESFFDFEDGSGNTLIDSVRAEGIKKSLGTYILGNSSIGGAIEELKKNSQILEDKWSQLGIGIKQDKLGLINMTFIYVE